MRRNAALRAGFDHSVIYWNGWTEWKKSSVFFLVFSFVIKCGGWWMGNAARYAVFMLGIMRRNAVLSAGFDYSVIYWNGWVEWKR